jgi:hypothetical protein
VTLTTNATTGADVVRAPLRRTVLAGILAGVTFNVAGFLTFVLIGTGLDNDGVLLDPHVQSGKMIAVWTTLRPLPKFQTQPGTILGIYLLTGIGYALLFRSVAAAWSRGFLPRTLRLATTMWALTCGFFELIGPFNLLDEPLALVGLECLFWAVMSIPTAAVIVAVIDRRHAATHPPDS